MLQTFNPNLKVISKAKLPMSNWKSLKNKKYADYLKVIPSKVYDAPNGGKGCTLSIVNKADDSIFTAWSMIAESMYPLSNGNFAPLDSGPYAAVDCNDSKANRILNIYYGTISDRLKSHMLEKGWSEAGIEKLVKDQLDWQSWWEGLLNFASEEAAALCVGKKRKDTKAFLKDNNVTDGVLNTLFKNTKEKDDVNTVKLVKIKGRELKEKEDGVFKLSAKSRLMQYGNPHYFNVLNHTDRDMEPFSIVPSQDEINKIFTKNGDGSYTYNQYNEETGEVLDKTLIRSNDLIKMKMRPKFYKSSDTIGFTLELREAVLLERPPNLKKRTLTSSYNADNTANELNDYF